MAELTYRDAVARGIAQEMARDSDVVASSQPELLRKLDVGHDIETLRTELAATGSETPCACAMSSLTMPISCTPRA